MTAAMTNTGDVNELVRAVATEIRNRNRGHIRELRIKIVEGGVILYGVCMSFYGKQIAFHEVRRICRMVVLANRIEVLHQAEMN
jgi:hypothetical protein